MTFAFTQPETFQSALGAIFTGQGTHFAVFSAHAEAIDLCLFSVDGGQEVARLPMPRHEGDVFSGYVPGVKPGQLYGYRAHGRYEPENGHRFNPHKLLLDPYARQISGNLEWNDALFGYDVSAAEADMTFDERDSAPFMVKGVVEDPDFDWESDEAIRHPWTSTVIYEAHVRGMTMQHPDVSDDVRGTYAGMASKPIIQHLKKLGITTIELLPCQYFLDDRGLIEKGLSNFWGYQTLGFFAPEPRFMKTGSIIEFKQMVKAFHKAGIEVLMDVVYNHTAEGSERGPTLSFRGLDNANYYKLSPDNPRFSFDQTGTGNTLNIAHPMVLRMVLDSLRYWVQVMHVDGFRFDLASTLGREDHGFDRDGAFFDAIRQDPILSSVKLIAEPWDIGAGGYQVGGFPHPFREWNDKFRDIVRSFWKGEAGTVGNLANHVLGSPVQFDHSNRTATSSVNFLSAHDGFTLMDTVSFNERHNEANGENGADGHNNNHSDNMGAEGATDDAGINAARLQRRRNMIATLFLCQGVPMILSGDEIGNSQNGNNNVYCQDNEIGWIDWSRRDDKLLDFTERMIKFRKEHPALTQEIFLSNQENTAACITWHQPDGREMTDDIWDQPELRVIGLYLDVAGQPHLLGEEQRDPLFIILNSGGEMTFNLPEYDGVKNWKRVINTAIDNAFLNEPVEGSTIEIAPASVSIFTPS